MAMATVTSVKHTRRPGSVDPAKMPMLRSPILRKSRMADSVAEQIAALKDDDWAIREEAAAALGAFRDPRAVEPLVSLLRDTDRAVREAAIGALRAIGEP